VEGGEKGENGEKGEKVAHGWLVLEEGWGGALRVPQGTTFEYLRARPTSTSGHDLRVTQDSGSGQRHSGSGERLAVTDGWGVCAFRSECKSLV